MTDVELTAARVRHLAHRGQLPETARMLAEDAYRDMTDANRRGDIPMAHAKSIQYQYWRRRDTTIRPWKVWDVNTYLSMQNDLSRWTA